MNQKGLKAIEVVGLTSYDDTDEYGASDILVFIDGKLAIPGTQYTFDGSKLEFSNGILRSDVMIYSTISGSYRILRPPAHGVCTSKVPDNIPVFTGKIVEVPKESEEKKDAVKETITKVVEAIPEANAQITVTKAPELSEDEINDITISQLGETTEPKEVE